jgi:endonuclease-3
MLDPAARKTRAKKVLAILNKEFPEAACSLDHREPFQLLIATILSAQCTDARVNQVTPGLFAAYPAPRDFAAASQEEIEAAIHSTGFYRQKAKSIRSCCRDLVEKHGGKLPETMAELSALAGVGRKTANVVLGVAFGKPEGVVVDTHVGRIAGKLGLTAHGPKEAVKIERDLNECVPRADWVAVAHLLIEHGRLTCRARAPRCDACPLFPHCETRA